MCQIFPRRRRARIVAGLLVLMVWCVFSVWFFYYYGNRSPRILPTVPAPVPVPVPEPPQEVQVQFRRNFTEQKEKILQVVHIDLKGSPPKVNYLTNLIFDLSRAGVSAIMIEYDDMFPYEGDLLEIAALSPYSKHDIREIVELCKSLDMEIIPMIQTLGHLEHVLKLDTFRYLREDQFDNRAACPTYSATMINIENMIKQIMKAHPNSKRIHIGCEEVTTLKKCQNCVEREDPPEQIFVEHVKAVATFIRKWYANKVTPLMWDNMLRLRSLNFLQSSKLSRYLEIVVQDTNSPISKSIRGEIWHKYTQVFPKIWVAGAFRGADGALSLFPNMHARFNNQDSWIDFLHSEVDYSMTTIAGYILTGSSKLDHFASSVDLLPVSKPSLILNVLKVRSALNSHQIHYYLKEFSEILKCKPDLYPMEMFDMKVLLERCDFEEKQIIDFTSQFQQFQPVVEKLHEIISENNTWATPFHINREFLNPSALETVFHNTRFYVTYSAFFEMFIRLKNEMRNFFKEHIVEEWFLQHVELFSVKVKNMHNVLANAVELETFRRRE